MVYLRHSMLAAVRLVHADKAFFLPVLRQQAVCL
jgi:hypothetical protein